MYSSVGCDIRQNWWFRLGEQRQEQLGSFVWNEALVMVFIAVWDRLVAHITESDAVDQHANNLSKVMIERCTIKFGPALSRKEEDRRIGEELVERR